MPKTQGSNKATPTKKHAPPTNRGIKPTIGYTLRTVPRNIWNPFRERLNDEGRTVNWALNQFIEEYGNGTLKLKAD